jgi:hypothetical protein
LKSEGYRAGEKEMKENILEKQMLMEVMAELRNDY